MYTDIRRYRIGSHRLYVTTTLFRLNWAIKCQQILTLYCLYATDCSNATDRIPQKSLVIRLALVHIRKPVQNAFSHMLQHNNFDISKDYVAYN